MVKLKVFLSSSNNDRDLRWIDRIRAHLAPYERTGQITFWNNKDIKPGDHWSLEIEQFLAEADIAILFISAEFLASNFIMNEEIPRLIKRHQQGLIILPIILRPCAWQKTPWIPSLQILPQDGQPLSAKNDPDQEAYDVAMRIIEIGEVISVQKASKDRLPEEKGIPTATTTTLTKGPSQEQDNQVFICHDGSDGDFAELLKLKLEKAGFKAWIDVDRLRVGDDWRAEIDEAIISSAALAVIMTPEAKESEYVTYEWAYAAGAGVKIIPLMLKTTQMHPRLESLQYLDFTNRRARPWERFIDELNVHSSRIEKHRK